MTGDVNDDIEELNRALEPEIGSEPWCMDEEVLHKELSRLVALNLLCFLR